MIVFKKIAQIFGIILAVCIFILGAYILLICPIIDLWVIIGVKALLYIPILAVLIFIVFFIMKFIIWSIDTLTDEKPVSKDIHKGSNQVFKGDKKIQK